MSTGQELIAAVKAGDAARVAAIVGEEPQLASIRDEDGISALMLSRYRTNRGVTDALLAVDPESGKARVLDLLHDEAWVREMGGPGPAVPSPGERWCRLPRLPSSSPSALQSRLPVP